MGSTGFSSARRISRAPVGRAIALSRTVASTATGYDTAASSFFSFVQRAAARLPLPFVHIGKWAAARCQRKDTGGVDGRRKEVLALEGAT